MPRKTDESRWVWIAMAGVVVCATGCKPPPAAGLNAAPAGTHSVPAAANINANADDLPTIAKGLATVPSAAANEDGIPLKLIESVEKLMALTRQWNEMAAQIQDQQTYFDRVQELAKIQEALSSHVEDVMTGEAKLTAKQKADFNKKYYEPQVKGLVEQQRQHNQRFKAFYK